MRHRAKARLYVEDDLGDGLAVGLTAAQAHYLQHVLRLGSGDVVALFNGRDGEWHARIDGFGRGWCSLVVEVRTRQQGTEPDIWLLFAPIKRARLDFLVQKAVELGASRLLPVMTRYTDVKRVNVERLRANVAEAAEQCERMTLPAVDEAQPMTAVMADWPSERRILLCAETGPAQPIHDILTAEAESGPAAAWAILTGPEGGFDPSELDALGKLPFVTPVSLGPRILRAETAALSALVCWQSVLGDWHSDRV